MASPIPADAPVTSAVEDLSGSGSATAPGYPLLGSRIAFPKIEAMEGSEGFNLFGDPDELRERLGELAEQMQGASAWRGRTTRSSWRST